MYQQFIYMVNYIAAFTNKAIQSALQRHRNPLRVRPEEKYLKCISKTRKTKPMTAKIHS